MKRKTAAAEPINKTAKKNANKGKAKHEGFIPCPEVQRVIPLCGGEYAYILNPTNGRTHHLKVDSDEYRNLIEVLGL